MRALYFLYGIRVLQQIFPHWRKRASDACTHQSRFSTNAVFSCYPLLFFSHGDSQQRSPNLHHLIANIFALEKESIIFLHPSIQVLDRCCFLLIPSPFSCMGMVSRDLLIFIVSLLLLVVSSLGALEAVLQQSTSFLQSITSFAGCHGIL